MNLLFLDIDGVLNGHDWHEGAQSNTLRRCCIDQLSSILRETDCRIVLSSAWRYLIHCRAMTALGFEALLRSHGTSGIVGKVLGVTRRDEDCCHCGYHHRRGRGSWNAAGFFVCGKCAKPSSRGDQIKAWRWRDVKDKGFTPPTTQSRIVALDDEDYGITEAGVPLVRTDGACGLTEADADKVIALFLGVG